MLFGQIDYINCLPVTLPLIEDKPADLQLRLGNPNELNCAYQGGELDVGAMSAHFYLQGGFEIFPTLSISSCGPVGSVFLFSKRQPEDLNDALVGLPAASASSVNLLKVLLFEMGVKPRFTVTSAAQSRSAEPLAGLDACLMLGDDALRADRRFGSDPNLVRRDMGQWWFERYSLPMVFGVWAARSSWASEHAEQFADLGVLLAQSVDKGLKGHFEAVLAAAQAATGLDRQRLQVYFQEELDYRFKPEHRQALALFGSLCREHKLLG